MRLVTGPTTPFGRMVEVLAAEAGIALDPQVVTVSEAEFLDVANPLRLIPTLLETPHGPLYDSRVICRYLASLAPEIAFYPGSPDWRFESRLALIAGLMDAGVARQGERSRPEASRSAAALLVLERRIRLGLSRLERDAGILEGVWPRMDAIAAAVLLDYVDFRVGRDWRASAARLAGWHETVRERASMTRTRFKVA